MGWIVYIKHLSALQKKDKGGGMMERLTEWKDNRNMLAKTKFSGDFGSANILCKLAEYEDLEELIGVPLKEIAELFRQNIPEDCKHPRKAIMLTDDDVDKWNGYKNAEEQGLLLRLPCPIGTTVYNTTWWDDVTEKVKVDGKIFYRTVRKHKVSKSTFSLLDVKDFGKTVFLTQEEAKQKLKEMESK